MATTNRDPRAGALLRSLRLDQGLSPEALSFAIYKAGHGNISARTIRRVEDEGMIPRVRNQFALAQYFGRTVTSIWDAGMARHRVAA